MKKLLTALFLLPVVLVLLLGVSIGIAMQQNLMSSSSLEFLLNLGKRDRQSALLAVLPAEIYGAGPETAAEPLNTIPGGSPSVPLAGNAKDGWRDLFDGKTLSGWRNMGGDENNVRKWTVQDGNLTLEQDGLLPSWALIKSFVFGGPVGDLVYYRQKFRNFELSLQWKIAPGGNSGIFYLIKDETESGSSRTGIEMQVLDNEGHADGKIRTHRSGDLYDLIAADPETVRPPGEWNDVLIRVKDDQIEHWLNGVKVVSILRGSEEWDALVASSKFADMSGYGKSEEGYIALQDHGDPVWYRNIRVREL